MDFEIPESLDGLDLDALSQLETDAVAAFDALRDDPNLDAAGLARLRELAAFVRQVRDQQAAIEQAAAQVVAELDDLDAAVHGGGDDEGDDARDGGEPAAAGEGEPAGDGEPAEATPHGSADAGGGVPGPPGGPAAAEAAR